MITTNNTPPLTKQQLNRKYRLHQKVKRHYRYSPASRTIYIPALDETQNPDVQELCNNYHYQVQLIIE